MFITKCQRPWHEQTTSKQYEISLKRRINHSEGSGRNQGSKEDLNLKAKTYAVSGNREVRDRQERNLPTGCLPIGQW